MSFSKFSRTIVGGRFITHSGHCSTDLSIGVRAEYNTIASHQYTNSQLMFVKLVAHLFADPNKSNIGFVVSAIGLCHSIVRPLILFSSICYKIEEKNFYILTIRKEFIGDGDSIGMTDIWMSGLNNNFTKKVSLPCNGHTATCTKKGDDYYVFDIALGFLIPVKLSDYLSIVIDSPTCVSITIHTMDETGSTLTYESVKLLESVKIQSIDKNSTAIKKLLQQNVNSFYRM